MRPKILKRPGPVPQRSVSALASEFQKLNTCIEKGWKSDEEISDAKTFMALKDHLKAQRERSTTLEPKFVKLLVRVLENGEEQICGRLDPSLFSTVINTILQSDYCRESERGLYLLADSLHQEGRGGKRVSVTKRKELIGSNSLSLLFERLVDTSGNPALRRWVGILCIELLQNASLNIDRLEYGSDRVRQSIGRLITEDENEIIKYICGKLVQVLQQANIELRSLWPKETSRVVLDEFPLSAQEDVSWSQQFQTYLDTVYDSQVSQHRRSDVLLYFASKCELDPLGTIGSPSHVKNMLITEDRITIQAPSSEHYLDTILDIPRTAVSALKIIATHDSRNEGNADAIFEIKEQTDDYCCLNGEAVLLSRISMLMPMDMIQNLRDDFPGAYGEIRVLDNEVPTSQREVVNSQGAIMTGSDDDEYRSNGEADKIHNPENVRAVNSQAAFTTGDDEEPYYMNDVQQNSTNSDENGLQDVFLSLEAVSVESDEEKYVARAKKDRVAQRSTKIIQDRNSEPDSSPGALPNGTVTNEVDHTCQRDALSEAEEDLPPLKKMIKPKLVARAEGKLPKQSKVLQDSTPNVLPQSGTESEYLDEVDLEEPKLPVTKNAIRRKAKKPIQVSRERLKNVVTEQEKANKSERNVAKQLAPTTSSQLMIEHLESSSPLSGIDKHDFSITSVRKGLDASQVTMNTVWPKLQAPTGKMLHRNPQALMTPQGPAGKAQSSIKPLPRPAKDITFDIEPDNDGDIRPPKERKTAPKRTARRPVTYSSSVKGIKKTAGKKKSESKKRHSAPARLENLKEDQVRLTRKNPPRKTRANKESAQVDAQVPVRDHLERKFHENLAQKSPESKKVHVSQVQFPVEKSRTKPIKVVQRMLPKHSREEKKVAEEVKSMPVPKAAVISLANVDSDNDEISPAFETVAPVDHSFNQDGTLSQSKIEDAEHNKKHSDLAGNQASPAEANNDKQQIVSKCFPEGHGRHKSSDSLSLFTHENINSEIEIQNIDGLAIEPELVLPNAITIAAAASGSPLKRKSEVSESTSSKRRRFDRSDATNHVRIRSQDTEEHLDIVFQPSESSVSAEEAIGVVLDTPAQLPSRTSTTETGPTKLKAAEEYSAKTPLSILQKRSSTQMAEREQNPGEVPKVLLVDDTVHRKITLIEFNKNGPRNQGQITTPLPAIISKAGNIPPSHALPAKRRKLDLVEDVGVPRKQQHDSPVCYDDNNESFENVQAAVMSSLEKSEEVEPIASRVSQYRVKSKTSSQNSRVTANGSPIAPPGISKLCYNIKAQERMKELEVEEPKTKGRGRSHSTLFGVKVILTSQPKTQPSSPDNVATRYVPHHKTNSGQFEHAQTKEVIPVQVVLPDPFVEAVKTPSRFAERLRKDSADNGRNSRGSAHVPYVTVPKMIKAMVSPASKKMLRAPVEDLERTLVKEDSVSLMPNLSSPSSRGPGRENSGSPLKMSPNGKWAMALRPHYTNLHEAIHRVADDILIRLSEEEDSMSLIVAQYQDNGTMMLSNVVRERNKEKTRMVGGLLEKRNCLLAAYEESKKVIKKTTEISKSVTSYEKEWKTKQLTICERIAEGRRDLD